MIEIMTFGLMVLAILAGTLGRDLWRARRDRQRAIQMESLTREFSQQPIGLLVELLGEAYEVDFGLSGRALHIWKAPPNEKLPRGSGLLTVVATVEPDGRISELEWRDRP